MSGSDRVVHPPSTEALTFLLVGGAGFVVDVVGYNVLRSMPWLISHDPSIAKTIAVLLAMVVTYWGNREFTWRDGSDADRRREIALFVVFNGIGLGFSVIALQVSHHLMGLTGPVADNISANVIGIGLGTVFRFWAYRTFVFVGHDAASTELAPRGIGRDRDPVSRSLRKH